MLLIRQNAADFSDVDFSSPGGGAIELPVPTSGSNVQWRILTAGYVSTGPAHAFSFFLAPLGPLGGPEIDVIASPTGGANSWTTCDIWVPRPSDTESWSLRFRTAGKAGQGTLSVSLELLEVLQ